jgi:predicted nucleotidyltransferase
LKLLVIEGKEFDIVMKRRVKLNKICNDYSILAVYIFGSMAEKVAVMLEDKKPEGINDPLADIDVGVVFLKRPLSPDERIKLYGRLYSELSEVFLPCKLDLIFLQEAGVILQFEAINGILVYSFDDDKRLEYEEQVIKFYQDWKPDYDEYTKEVLEAIT